MVDLARWLGECLDEDERIARRACEYAEASWRLDADGETILWWPPEPRVAEKEREHGLPVVSDQWRGQTIGSGGERIAPHVAEWDPARVLREIEIDRELLAEYERLLRAHEAHRKEADRLTQSDDDDPFRRNALRREADYLPATLHVVERWAKRKAAVYSHRPGFKEEWRP